MTSDIIFTTEFSTGPYLKCKNGIQIIQICFFSLFVLSSVLTWQRSSLRVVLFTYCGNVLNYKLKYPNKKTSAELYLFVYDEKPGIHFLLFAVVFQYTLEGFTFLIIVHWEHISLLNADCIFMFL